MTPTIWQLALVGILAVFLLGGRGRISALMTDVAEGIKSFRKGMVDDDKVLETSKNKDTQDDAKA